MNVLLIIQSSKPSGIAYYRQLMPHAYLKTLYPETNVEQVQGATLANINTIPDEKLKEFQVVVLSREVNSEGTGTEIIRKFKKLGLNVVVDVDDYWLLPSYHRLKKAYTYYKIPELITNNISEADAVTCTNKFLADKIKPYNGKVFILPNCVDKGQSQFRVDHIPDNGKIRFGWIGGVHHRYDIEPLERSFEKLWRDKELKDRWELYLGGFNKNQEYKEIEKIFTCNYKFLDVEYKEYLNYFTPLVGHMSNGKPYKRLWAMDVFSYISMYNNLDVCLVPLKDNDFNSCKSELKIIEAAAMGKAVIASNVYPYNQVCNSSNSILINSDRPHKDWYEAMRYCIEHPAEVKRMAEQLSKDCEEKFNINHITNERKNLYTWLTK